MTNGQLLYRAICETDRLLSYSALSLDRWNAIADRYEQLKAEVAAKLNGAEARNA